MRPGKQTDQRQVPRRGTENTFLSVLPGMADVSHVSVFCYPPLKVFQVFTIGETILAFISSQNEADVVVITTCDGKSASFRTSQRMVKGKSSCSLSFCCKTWGGSFTSLSPGFLICKVRTLGLKSSEIVFRKYLKQ